MLTLSILFLALLFILGLITTLFNFPTKKFQSWIYSLSIKAQTPTPSPLVKNSTLSSPPMAEQKIMRRSTSNSHNKVELRSIFATFDKNNDGYITKQELKQSLKNIGIYMEDIDIVEMVEKVDSNKDGLIDLDEFYELCHSFLGIEGIIGSQENSGEMNQEEEANRERDLKDAFDVFDYDKDGLISEEELSKVLSSLGLNQGKKLEDCKEMIRKIDVDGDGMVNFDEFKKMMKVGGRLIPIS
ncbi:calmodulin-like protein 3 [Nicotiana tabacum]|uniref:Calmodulin-like protein 3 n=1 Tax=Nicotiana tabacum TaxID=4097 RepID=A0A1S3ZHF0_TOBAC|nr:calmodulin-like protein 3 [Nicotiana tomentosiformis]XP_016463804.1 PREDICTED: calmodulin-like protein 3 [Nicotiana tabacum]